ncbi:hypothetical protein R3P38DRAFT_2805953 [Favolaschia claudopus]|uniref:Uncharacterized protein n=1 Tax=Favolaschia claudopus TaxID=2862362 RepID=A0AAV9ZLY6_9AGAR
MKPWQPAFASILTTIFVGLSSYLWYRKSSAQNCVRYAPAFRLRGGDASDDEYLSPDDDDRKRKRKAKGKQPTRKRASTSNCNRPSRLLRTFLVRLAIPRVHQAQGLADVIILRQMNRDSPGMHFDNILMLIWKTCLVHFTRYAHPIPFLIVSTEVRCSAKEQDAQNARIIQEMISSGVLQNPNNSLQSRMKSQAQRKARASEKLKRITDAELLTENETLRKQIAMLSKATFSATPSTPKKLQPVASSSQLPPSPSNSIIDVDSLFQSPPSNTQELADSDSDDLTTLRRSTRTS